MLVALDVDEEEGGRLRGEYGIRAFPTFSMITPEGEIIDQWLGYGQPQEWIEHLDRARTDMSTLAEKTARYDRAPDVATAKILARNADASGEAVKAVRYLDDLLRMDPDNRGDYLYDRFDAIVGGVRQELFTPDDAKAAADEVLDGPGLTDTNRMLTAYYMRRVANTAHDDAYYLPYLKSAMKVDRETVEEGYGDLHDLLHLDYVLKIDRNVKKALKMKKGSMEEGWREDPDQLNSFAWWCFENSVNLKEAQKLAETAVRLSDEGSGRANILDTLAEICFARGKKKQAIEYMEQAIDLDPGSDYFKSQLEKFGG